MTRDVKSRTAVENRGRVNYNGAVSTARILGCFVAALLLCAASCGKEKNNPKQDTGVINAIDRTPSGSGATANKEDSTPLKGIDTSKLEGDRLSLFNKLVNQMKSPCGKSHSLRVSFNTDAECKRAPYAVKYILALLEDEMSEDAVIAEYQYKYEAPKDTLVKLDLSKAPRIGNDDAPVRLVEFYDYACPHCYAFRTVLEKVASERQGKVCEYFMMYPLGHKEWPHSKSAGQAAIAAYHQGKFKEMHELLFEQTGTGKQPPPHSEQDVLGYAKQLGLDIAKFTADYKAADAQVEADKVQGQAAKVHSTPTIFLNERKFPHDRIPAGQIPKYMGMWIDEEDAVNR
jgi:protein-disulfide isomerase